MNHYFPLLWQQVVLGNSKRISTMQENWTKTLSSSIGCKQDGCKGPQDSRYYGILILGWMRQILYWSNLTPCKGRLTGLWWGWISQGTSQRRREVVATIRCYTNGTPTDVKALLPSLYERRRYIRSSMYAYTYTFMPAVNSSPDRTFLQSDITTLLK